MTIRRVLLSGTGTSGDGTTWNDLSDATSAYIAKAGFDTAIGLSAAGDTVYAKGTDSDGNSLTVTSPSMTAALSVNPVKIIGVRTDAGDTVAQTDIILGERMGDATRAYAQTAGEAPPNIVCTGAADITLGGPLYIYGFIFEAQDNGSLLGTTSDIVYEECEFISGNASSDAWILGTTASGTNTRKAIFRNCLLTMGDAQLLLTGNATVEFYNCVFISTHTNGSLLSTNWSGTAKLVACDLTGVHANLVNMSNHNGTVLEFWNCRMPASHILTLGTATEQYTVINYGSEDSTGLTTGGSEQAYQKHTHFGTVDIETTKVRTGGADDGADGGWSYALTITNAAADDFAFVSTPWMRVWVTGVGTAQTLDIYIANDDTESAGNLLQDDEVFMEVGYPSESGLSMFEYDVSGRAALLPTAANLTTTSETWGAGANNDQKLTLSIAPDYEGWVYSKVHYSKSVSPPVLYVDAPEIV